MLNQGKKSGLQFRGMLRGSGQRNTESAPVGAIQNVLLSQHGFILRSPPRKQPGGRREPQRALRLTHFPGGSGILYTLPGFPANGARREAERERRTGQGRWRGGQYAAHAAPWPRHAAPQRAGKQRPGGGNGRPGGAGTPACMSHHPTVEAREYEHQDFVALACRARRTVQVRRRAPSGSRLFPPPGLRLVLTALSPTSPRLVVRHAG